MVGYAFKIVEAIVIYEAEFQCTSSMLQTVMIGVLPLIFVILGIIVIVERRKRRNEKG